MIFTRVERHWFAFIFHISPRNSKSSWDCSSSKRSNLRGTPGASRIFCSVVADQLLANPPGYPPRKIVFKLKKNQPKWHGIFGKWVCVYSEKEELVHKKKFLYSEILWGFQGELLNGKLEITLAYEYFIILYIPFLNSVRNIDFLRAAAISYLRFVPFSEYWVTHEFPEPWAKWDENRGKNARILLLSNT